MMNTRSQLENSNVGPLARGQSRRAFLRMIVAGARVAALGTMTAACGPGAPAVPAPTLAPAPAAAAKPPVTAPTAAGSTPAAGATAAGATQVGSTGGQISIQ